MANVLVVPLLAAACALSGACFAGAALRRLALRHPPGRHRFDHSIPDDAARDRWTEGR
ncbi:hypothetical protein [Actinomadura harenae]|uniref:hypothetical protein n=1 Tax=Actinomadura harenae TaxID=2483351 RepID=UPI0013159D61|nr:hypothetical protein [Actinomadura harenae]